MISRRLCATLATEALLLLIAMSSLFGGRGSAPAAFLAAFAGFFLVNTCAVVLAYAILRAYAVALGSPDRLSGARTWRCAILEMLAMFAVFLVLQPFERLWMGKDTVGKLRPGGTLVLLVHGYLCNRGLWWWIRRRLRSRHLAIATVNLEPPLADLNQLAAQLARRIDAVLEETGAEKLILITHSMGGLVSRAYLQANGAARVARLLMLAAPTHGTHVARLSCGVNARQMRPRSQWLQRLNAQPLPPIAISNIWTRDDEILLPPDTARLEQVREIVFEDVGHLAIVFSPRVVMCLEAEIARA